MGKKILVVGAGLSGSLFAGMVAKRGWKTLLVDKRPDPRLHTKDAFNVHRKHLGLLLTWRGKEALMNQKEYFTEQKMNSFGLPVWARTIHSKGRDGQTHLQHWGNSRDETLLAVDREMMLCSILDWAQQTGGSNLEVRFEETKYCEVNAIRNGGVDLVVGADGVESIVREAMLSMNNTDKFSVNFDKMEQGWKGFHIVDGGEGLVRDTIHTWPRGSSFLHCLPSTRGGFVATLVMGMQEFPKLETEAGRKEFEDQYFDAFQHFPKLMQYIPKGPGGILGLVQCNRFHSGSGNPAMVIIGDAAHATVPFAGQGMNSALEDSVILSECLGSPETCGFSDTFFQDVAAKFSQLRVRDAHSMQAISMEQYKVISRLHDSSLNRLRVAYQQKMGKLLPSVYPESLYKMINFSKMPYSTALKILWKQNKPWKIGRIC